MKPIDQIVTRALTIAKSHEEQQHDVKPASLALRAGFGKLQRKAPIVRPRRGAPGRPEMAPQMFE